MERLPVLHLQEEGRRGEQHDQCLCLIQCLQQPLTDATDLDQVMNDKVPDNVLLEIFDFYRADTMIFIHNCTEFTWRWEILIQVCRRWRCVIFGSPCRLDLQVVCTDTTPVMTLLDIWPAFLSA
jgi:hypothetical protein